MIEGSNHGFRLTGLRPISAFDRHDVSQRASDADDLPDASNRRFREDWRQANRSLVYNGGLENIIGAVLLTGFTAAPGDPPNLDAMSRMSAQDLANLASDERIRAMQAILSQTDGPNRNQLAQRLLQTLTPSERHGIISGATSVQLQTLSPDLQVRIVLGTAGERQSFISSLTPEQIRSMPAPMRVALAAGVEPASLTDARYQALSANLTATDYSSFLTRVSAGLVSNAMFERALRNLSPEQIAEVPRNVRGPLLQTIGTTAVQSLDWQRRIALCHNIDGDWLAQQRGTTAGEFFQAVFHNLTGDQLAAALCRDESAQRRGIPSSFLSQLSAERRMQILTTLSNEQINQLPAVARNALLNNLGQENFDSLLSTFAGRQEGLHSTVRQAIMRHASPEAAANLPAEERSNWLKHMSAQQVTELPELTRALFSGLPRQGIDVLASSNGEKIRALIHALEPRARDAFISGLRGADIDLLNTSQRLAVLSQLAAENPRWPGVLSVQVKAFLNGLSGTQIDGLPAQFRSALLGRLSAGDVRLIAPEALRSLLCDAGSIRQVPSAIRAATVERLGTAAGALPADMRVSLILGTPGEGSRPAGGGFLAALISGHAVQRGPLTARQISDLLPEVRRALIRGSGSDPHALSASQIGELSVEHRIALGTGIQQAQLGEALFNALRAGLNETQLQQINRPAPIGPSNELIPHISWSRLRIDDSAFSLPMGGRATIAIDRNGRPFVFDGSWRPNAADIMTWNLNPPTPVMELSRSENGWLVRSVGDGFYRRTAGAGDFAFVEPGTDVSLGANDQIRLLEAAESPVLTFRPEGIQQPPEPPAGQPRMRVRANGRERMVEVIRPDGSRAEANLFVQGGWANTTTGSADAPVKLHINVLNSADLARLQPVVIDALLRDPVLSRLVTAWKTMDPSFAMGENARSLGNVNPTGQGQRAKGFTIYCATAADALVIQQRLSQILAENNLALQAPLQTGNVDALDARTHRVGVVRETWPATGRSDAEIDGFLLDAELARRMFEDPSRAANRRGRTLSLAELRALETSLHLLPNTLTYDHQDRLMLLQTDDRHDPYSDGSMYADESQASRPDGLADRAALYALYRRHGLDPVQESVLGNNPSAVRPSDVSPQNLPAEFQQIAANLSDNPFLRGATISNFMRRVAGLEDALSTIANPQERARLIGESLQTMVTDMRPALGNTILSRIGGIRVVPNAELDLAGAANGSIVLRRRNGQIVDLAYINGGYAMENVNEGGQRRLRRVPLSQLTLELNVPASSLSADLNSAEGSQKFGRMLSTLFEQLNRVHRIGGLSQTEMRDPHVRTQLARTGNVIAEYMATQLQVALDPFRRTSADYSGMTQEELRRAAENLTTAFSGRPIRTGLMSDASMEYFIAEFRSRSNQIFSQTGDNASAQAQTRAAGIQRLVREMLGMDGMQIGIDPSRVIIEAGTTNGGTAQQLARHAGGAGQPAIEGDLVGREGGNARIRLANGEVVSRPLAEVSLVIRLPEAQLNHASGPTGEGTTVHTRASANQVASSVFRFLAQADAVLNGRAPASTTPIQLAQISELAARGLEYELNAHRLTPNHNLPAVQLNVDVARVIGTANPRGTIQATVVDGVVRYEHVEGNARRSLNEQERERLDRSLRERFERLYAESIREFERMTGDTSLSTEERAQARLHLQAIRQDLQQYRDNPQRRAEVHSLVPRNAGTGAGAGGLRGFLSGGSRIVSASVIILILSQTARQLLSSPGTGGGGLELAPVRPGT